MSFKERMKKNIDKLEGMINQLDERMFNLLELKAKYEDMIETEDFYNEQLNKVKAVRMNRLLNKLHKEFYKKRSRK
jgi:hypothetical protein